MRAKKGSQKMIAMGVSNARAQNWSVGNQPQGWGGSGV